MKHKITQVENGVTVRVEGATYVFNDPEKFGQFVATLYNFGETPEYVVMLKSVTDKFISAIKFVRETNGMSLKDSKDLVDRVINGFPQPVHTFRTPEQALEVVKKFEQAGHGAQYGKKEGDTVHVIR